VKLLGSLSGKFSRLTVSVTRGSEMTLSPVSPETS
jgi:hypothetical protein